MLARATSTVIMAQRGGIFGRMAVVLRHAATWLSIFSFGAILFDVSPLSPGKTSGN